MKLTKPIWSKVLMRPLLIPNQWFTSMKLIWILKFRSSESELYDWKPNIRTTRTPLTGQHFFQTLALFVRFFSEDDASVAVYIRVKRWTFFVKRFGCFYQRIIVIKRSELTGSESESRRCPCSEASETWRCSSHPNYRQPLVSESSGSRRKVSRCSPSSAFRTICKPICLIKLLQSD